MENRLSRIAVACTLALALTAPAAATSVNWNLTEYQRTIDRDDTDAGLNYPAIYACEHGDRSAAVSSPAVGCVVASDNALALQRFDEALRHAMTGCEKYRSAASCRAAARVPLHMGNASVPVPARFAAELKRLAQFVCLSGERVTNEFAGDQTGRECSNLARQFILARDGEYRNALMPAARAYFEAKQDPRLASELYTAACRRWNDGAGCEQLRVATRIAEDDARTASSAAAKAFRVSVPVNAR